MVRRGKSIARVIGSRAAPDPAPFHERFCDALEITGDILAPLVPADERDAVRGEWEPSARPAERRR